jgi:uncharacterized membrane protein YfcA
MDYLVISLVALLASGLTLFSGFGLGTLLMPVVALFFPLEIAIAITAVVHLANNLFKVALLGKAANFNVLARFGMPAIVFAFIGAYLLSLLSQQSALIEYSFMGHIFSIQALKLIVGLLILVFVILEFLPNFKKIALHKKYLPVGGMISGFFGGLSGHQGAFRSMFLIKAGLNKTQFIATGVMIAVLVDISRLLFYGSSMIKRADNLQWGLIVTASLSAFLGAYIGKRMIEKVTIRSIQWMVSALLIVVAFGLISGVI